MNRNSSSRFSENPIVNIERSTFNRDSQLKTTFNAGDLIPIYVDEVLPGDTFAVNEAAVIRLSNAPVVPVMDNMFCDTYYFFVPSRLLWEHWREFQGENRTTYWTQPTTYTIPQITAPAGTGWTKGTIADMMGIPTGVAGLSVNHLPFRAYVQIWNEWFRDQNVSTPANCPLTDATTVGVNSATYVTDAIKGGMPLKVAKIHDYFTSALPSPQKGADVMMPMVSGDVPVVQKSQHTTNLGTDGLRLVLGTGNPPPGQFVIEGHGGDGFVVNGGGSASVATTKLYASNLWAELGMSSATTINQLRLAFQTQKFFEKDARGGTRYPEMIRSHFGVVNPDARVQRPEYLGGKRIPINISQVVQTSSTDATSPQGNVAAYSLTVDRDSMFVKSFTEHGYILGLACVRTEHTYQQGVDRMWSRQDRIDFYFPSFANIGEQAILNKEIYAKNDANDNLAFGYQEAWAEYRYKPSRVAGAFRSNYATPLDMWHYADKYASLPTLSHGWLVETVTNVDRTLSVASTVEDQFIADFYFGVRATRPMPVYSIPGLIDHN